MLDWRSELGRGHIQKDSSLSAPGFFFSLFQTENGKKNGFLSLLDFSFPVDFASRQNRSSLADDGMNRGRTQGSNRSSVTTPARLKGAI